MRIGLNKLAAAGAILSVTCLTARAEDYPTRPITIIVPLQAGTASDLVVRVLGDELGKRLGQQVVVENVTGAGGAVGAGRVAKAEADGYTLGAFNNGIYTILPYLDNPLQFDPNTDFIPISMLAQFPSVLIVNPGLGVSSLAELIALAKEKPGELTYASVGHGSPQHLAMEEFKTAAGIDLRHVTYTGGSQATLAVSTDEVNAFWIATSVALPFITAGQVTPIAVGERERTAALPDVPTVAEAGVEGFSYAPWLALYAPAETPAPLVEKLRGAVVETIESEAVTKRLAEQGLVTRATTPEDQRAVEQAEAARMQAVIAALKETN